VCILPDVVEPSGLSHQRKVYLAEKIRPLVVSPTAKDILCPVVAAAGSSVVEEPSDQPDVQEPTPGISGIGHLVGSSKPTRRASASSDEVEVAVSK